MWLASPDAYINIIEHTSQLMNTLVIFATSIGFLGEQRKGSGGAPKSGRRWEVFASEFLDVALSHPREGY